MSWSKSGPRAIRALDDAKQLWARLRVLRTEGVYMQGQVFTVTDIDEFSRVYADRHDGNYSVMWNECTLKLLMQVGILQYYGRAAPPPPKPQKLVLKRLTKAPARVLAKPLRRV